MSVATYHLWVKPSGAVRDMLAQTIRELARELGGPVFEPHVTLLGNLAGTEEEHIQRSQIATPQLQPFNIILSQPSYGTQYFQCVFMRAEQTPPLISANTVVKRIFKKPDEIYMPHLSLVYGLYPESRKRNIIRKLPPDVKTRFEVTAFSLIRADSNDPNEWHEISIFSFTG